MGILQSQTAKLKHHLENEVLSSIYPPPSTETLRIPSREPSKVTLHHGKQITLNAKPIKKPIESGISVHDGRIKVPRTTAWPYSVHGVIAMRFKGVNDVRWGTGTLIGPNIVLTAGHNLYSHEHKAYAELKSLQFLPGMNVKTPPFGVIKVEQFFVSDKYVKEEKEDFGILVLKEPIGKKTGYFGLACLESEEIKGKIINVTGYPHDKVIPGTYEMWTMGSSDGYVEKTNEFINYPIDTAIGQSGGGVWFEEEGKYYVCGIHVHGGFLFNQGVLMTKSIYNQIYAWLNKASLQEYLLKVEDITALEFKDFKIDAQCISLLLKYNLEGLTTLDFSNQSLGTEGVQALAQKASWESLSRLLLCHNQIGTEGAIALANNTSWNNLFVLHLSSNSIGPEGARALAQNSSLKNLRHLNLFLNKIGAEGAKALAENIHWNKLSRIYLGANNIGTEGAVELAKNTSWVSLKHLGLHSNHIGPKGGAELARNATWKNLIYLNLGWNEINEGVAALAQNKSWTNLCYLDLSFSHISQYGVEALSSNTSWSNLSTLHLFCCDVDEEQVKTLSKNDYWTCLTSDRINISEFPLVYDKFSKVSEAMNNSY